jgi:hypothetical protein
MRYIITVAAACAGLICTQAVAGDFLRCGDALIGPGDTAAFVLENCFGATQQGANGIEYQISMAQLQRWRIIRESGQFEAVVVIGADGRVETIEFDRRRD